MLFWVLLNIVLIVVYVFFKERYAYWEKRRVPYPKPTFLFGNTRKAVMMTSVMSKICTDIYNEYRNYAYVGFFNFWTPAVVVRDIELVKDVLTKRFNNFHDNWIETEYEVDPVMAKNLFIARSDEWKSIRTLLTSQYTTAKLKGLIPVMQNVSKLWIAYIEHQIDTKKSNCLDITDLVARYNGENVLTAAYGLDGKSFTDEVPVAFKIGEEISDSSFKVQIKQVIGFFFPRLRRMLKFTIIGSPITKVFWDLVLNTMKYRDDNNIVRNDYLDFIRELRKSKAVEVTDADVVAHAFTLFLDGFETSSVSMSFALYELALHKDVQDKARAEIDMVLEKYKGTLTHEALQDLQYMENILFENLRKNPIILFLSRVCTEKHVFPPAGGLGTGKDVVIEEGTQVFIPVNAIHHDPQFYPDPEKFDPDRFSGEAKGTRQKGCFLGFGDGPRICLGRNYALMQIKIGLVAILSQFEVRMSNKSKIPYERDHHQLLNIPKGGIFVELHRRLR